MGNGNDALACEHEAAHRDEGGAKKASTGNAVTFSAAMGLWLAWFWLACGEGMGIPSRADELSAGGLLASLAAAALVAAVSGTKPLVRWCSRPHGALAVGVLGVFASFCIAVQGVMGLPLLAIALCSIASCAAATWLAVLLLSKLCAWGPREAFLLLLKAWLGSAVAFYLAVNVPAPMDAVVFALLPVVVAVLLERSGASPRAAASQKTNLATPYLSPHEAHRRFLELLAGVALFFFTIGFVRATGLAQADGPQNFSLGASASTIFLVLLALAAWAYQRRREYEGLSLNFIRGCYTFAALGIAFATMTMALGNTGTLAVRSVTDSAYLVLLLAVFTLLVAAVHVQGMPLYRTVALFAATALGAACCGWGLQMLLEAAYPSPNTTTTMLLSLGFLCFAYFMFGFPATACSLFMARAKDMPDAVALETADASDGEGRLGGRRRGSVGFREATLATARQAQLSQRETEVFCLLAKGWSNDYIAEELTVSYHTVRAHVRNIYSKLDAHDRQDILAAIDKMHRALNADAAEAE